MNFFFNYPIFLYFLLIIPLIIVIHFLGEVRYRKRAILFSNFEALERVSGIEFFSKSFFVLFLDVVLIILIVFSMAQLNVQYSSRTDSFNHVILIDSSRSMGVDDVGMIRLDLAKDVAISFVEMMPKGVEFGVISFAGEPKIIKKLDSSKLLTLGAIKGISFIQVDGSNLINPILLADSLFSDERKSLLIVSDGEFYSEDFLESLEYLAESNIVVNTILIGSEFGGRDDLGALHKTNSEFMKSLAFNSGGKYFELRKSGVPLDFKEVFVESDREINLNLTIYLLITTLVIFVLLWFVNNFRIRILPF
jgi:Ca-activated chloride channel family protein